MWGCFSGKQGEEGPHIKKWRPQIFTLGSHRHLTTCLLGAPKVGRAVCKGGAFPCKAVRFASRLPSTQAAKSSKTDSFQESRVRHINNAQTNPRAHKNKIGTPPPKKTQNSPPPKTRNFMDMALPAERTHFLQASIKLAQPSPAPELQTKILRTRGFFWNAETHARLKRIVSWTESVVAAPEFPGWRSWREEVKKSNINMFLRRKMKEPSAPNSCASYLGGTCLGNQFRTRTQNVAQNGTSAERILARSIFIELRIFLLKMLRNFPRIVWAFIVWIRKKPAKFPCKNRCPIRLDNRRAGQWKWMEEVPCRTSLVPLAFPCFVLCFVGVETEGLLDYQGRAGIISIVRWNADLIPIPGQLELHGRCRYGVLLSPCFGALFVADLIVGWRN